MFELDLTELKAELGFLLDLNEKWLFHKGKICVIHPLLSLAYSEFRYGDIKETQQLNDMTELGDLLSSKTIVKAYVSPRGGIIAVKRPYKLKVVIDALEDEKTLAGYVKYMETMKRMRECDGVFKDLHKQKHNCSSFVIDNVEFRDIIDRSGDCEATEIRVKDTKLVVKNHKLGRVITYGKIKEIKDKTFQNIKIIMSSDGMDNLRDSLLGEKSDVTIANGALILVRNRCDSLIAGKRAI